MNIILILVDSLNKHCLQMFNPQSECRTPNLDRLGARSHVFENHFISSLPCMPARRELFAGRKEFLWRPWGSLEVFDPRLPSIIGANGFNTGIVTDHYHYWEEEANGYLQGFRSIEFIRGHEVDAWRVPEAGPLPAWVEKMAEFRARKHVGQYYANVRDFRGEEDYFPAKVFSRAAEWLEDNAQKGHFFLQIESFDVHEPFDTPEPYGSMYNRTGKSRDDFNIWPPYQVYADLDAFMAQTSEQELAFLRSQYMGKTTMADAWLGRLMDTMDRLSLWDDTMVIFTTDHGHDLGERGVFGKQFPHYDSHANIPMIIWHPQHWGDGRRVTGLTQTVDLFATIIEAAGADLPPENRHSRSLMPLIRGESTDVRDAILYGTFGQGICICDGDWTLFRAPVEGKPLFVYSTAISRPLIVDNPVDGRVGRPPEAPVDQGFFDPTVSLPMWKIPIKIDPRTHQNFLYNRATDPDQTVNLWDAEPEQRDRLLALARTLMDDEGYPPEQLDRLGMTHTH